MHTKANSTEGGELSIRSTRTERLSLSKAATLQGTTGAPEVHQSALELVRIRNRAPRDLAASSRPFRICTHTHTSHSHSSHALLCRLCWQMLDPPHSLHRLVCRLCWQIPSLRTPCITSAAPSSFPSRSLRPQAQHCEHLSAAVPRTRSAPSSGDGTTKSERSWPRSSPHTPRCFRKARRRQ